MKERISNPKLGFPLCNTYVGNKPARKLEFPEAWLHRAWKNDEGKLEATPYPIKVVGKSLLCSTKNLSLCRDVPPPSEKNWEKCLFFWDVTGYKNLGSCQKVFLRGHCLVNIYFTYLKLCLKMCFLFWCSTLSVYSFLCFLRNLWKSLSTGSSSWWIVVKSPMGFREVEAPSLSRDRLSMFQHHLSWCTVKNNKSLPTSVFNGKRVTIIHKSLTKGLHWQFFL